jgi:uncharacterized protein (TIGR01244 family)
VFVGGQPTAEQLAAAREAGVRTVVNLQRPREEGAKGERRLVEKAGMAYVALPMSKKELTVENARALDQALAAAERPVLVHDSNGSRAGALFALRARFVEGKSSEEALAIGRMVGLGALEPSVRSVLEGGPPAAAASERARKPAGGKAHKGGREKKAKADGEGSSGGPEGPSKPRSKKSG